MLIGIAEDLYQGKRAAPNTPRSAIAPMDDGKHKIRRAVSMTAAEVAKAKEVNEKKKEEVPKKKSKGKFKIEGAEKKEKKEKKEEKKEKVLRVLFTLSALSWALSKASVGGGHSLEPSAPAGLGRGEGPALEGPRGHRQEP